MAREYTIKCDQCGELIPLPYRGVLLTPNYRKYRMSIVSDPQVLETFHVAPLGDNATVSSEEQIMLCGMNCASKLISSWLEQVMSNARKY